MSFVALKQQYARGAIAKPAYIAQAAALHQQLFAYVGVMQTTDVREIRITPEGVCFVVGEEGLQLWCPPGEGRLVPLEVMNFDHYEPVETAVMDGLAAGARQILDVGASIGWHALRFATRLPRAQVHAFEPLPEPYVFLQRNLAANGLAGRVQAHPLGLADRNGAADYFVSPGHGTNAALLNVADAPDAVRVPGQVSTLDAWAQRHGVAPDFIKCDVEGAELLVLRGARDTLARHRPIVFAELLRKWCKPFGHHPNDVLALMAGHGYTCHAVGADGVRPLVDVDEHTPETHYAFLHPARHAAALERLQTFRSPTP